MRILPPSKGTYPDCHLALFVIEAIIGVQISRV